MTFFYFSNQETEIISDKKTQKNCDVPFSAQYLKVENRIQASVERLLHFICISVD